MGKIYKKINFSDDMAISMKTTILAYPMTKQPPYLRYTGDLWPGGGGGTGKYGCCY